jgi:hypothetical protein
MEAKPSHWLLCDIALVVKLDVQLLVTFHGRGFPDAVCFVQFGLLLSGVATAGVSGEVLPVS